MKKLLLIAIGTISGLGAFAQSAHVNDYSFPHSTKASFRLSNRAAARTAYADSVVLTNIYSSDTPLAIYFVGNSGVNDSGYFYGTNIFGFNEFAERYDVGTFDSTVNVLGVQAYLTGTVHSASTKKITFKVWNVGSPVAGSTTLSYSGYPNTVLDSTVVSYDSLDVTDSTYTVFNSFFTTPTAYLSTSFFTGCSLSTYNWAAEAGDTVGIITTNAGQRHSAVYTVSGGDTIVNDQSMVNIPSGGGWYDLGYDLGDDLNYYLFPIVNTYIFTTGFKGITRNDLTFYGNYPNPATDNTNIKFSLANNEDVSIIISDMAGHIINTINETNLAPGMHIIPLATSNMPTGDYIYLVRTASGAGMAGKMTVIK